MLLVLQVLYHHQVLVMALVGKVRDLQRVYSSSMNVCTRFPGKPSNNFCDISLKATVSRWWF